MRFVVFLWLLVLVAAACGGSSPADSADDGAGDPADTTPTTSEVAPAATPDVPDTPGGYDFDRSDPEGGVANIMEAFATDQATAECIYEAWGDVANVAPEDLTPELMTFPICGTSLFQMMTGDARFTGQESG